MLVAKDDVVIPVASIAVKLAAALPNGTADGTKMYFMSHDCSVAVAWHAWFDRCAGHRGGGHGRMFMLVGWNFRQASASCCAHSTY